jgi:hypothetical protein
VVTDPLERQQEVLLAPRRALQLLLELPNACDERGKDLGDVPHRDGRAAADTAGARTVHIEVRDTLEHGERRARGGGRGEVGRGGRREEGGEGREEGKKKKNAGAHTFIKTHV